MYNTSMYVLASQLSSLPVISLQTGETVAQTCEPIIDPASLSLLAYRCELPHGEHTHILLVQDIREYATDCLIVDSEDELTEPTDVIRLRPFLKAAFTPLGRTAITDLGRRVGRVDNYTVNLETSRIQKLYIRQPIWRSWSGSSLIIDRSQVIDVTPQQIVIRDTTTPAALLATEPTPKSHS